jgi:pimeloyl-ACP methyl ester carboxylesterase
MFGRQHVFIPSLSLTNPQITPSPDLEWHPCYTFYNPNFLCARLTVPMDYSRPLNSSRSVPKVHIALLLLPGQGTSASALNSTSPQPKQPLLVNPGGPGGSGVLLNLLLGPSLQKVLGADQPVLGFDPRGIAFTTPLADCWAVPWTTSSSGRRTGPANNDDDEGNTAAGLLHRLEWERVNQAYGLISEGEPWMRYVDLAQRGVVELCRRHAENVEATKETKETILRWAGTRHVARDMLSIIDAWDRWVYGQRPAEHAASSGGLRGKLVYWGFSYGTYLGATFAKMFPDGVVDAVGYEEAVWPESLVDTDKVLETFFKFCAEAGRKCDLYRKGDSAEDVKRRYEGIMDRLKTDPVTFTHPDHFYPVVLRYGLVKNLVFSILYQPMQGFPLLATFLNYIYEGDYHMLGPLFQDAELLCTLTHNPLLSETMSDAQRAIMCGDKAQPVSQSIPTSLRKFSNSHGPADEHDPPRTPGRLRAHVHHLPIRRHLVRPDGQMQHLGPNPSPHRPVACARNLRTDRDGQPCSFPLQHLRPGHTFERRGEDGAQVPRCRAHRAVGAGPLHHRRRVAVYSEGDP